MTKVNKPKKEENQKTDQGDKFDHLNNPKDWG